MKTSQIKIENLEKIFMYHTKTKKKARIIILTLDKVDFEIKNVTRRIISWQRGRFIKRTKHTYLAGMQNGTDSLEKSLEVSYKVNYILNIHTSNLTPLLLGNF